MFPVNCWFDPVRNESCPSDPSSLKKCISLMSKDELCERGSRDDTSAGIRNINNCGDYDVYTTNCRGTNSVYNP